MVREQTETLFQDVGKLHYTSSGLEANAQSNPQRDSLVRQVYTPTKDNFQRGRPQSFNQCITLCASKIPSSP